jgi:hypothetical protein
MDLYKPIIQTLVRFSFLLMLVGHTQSALAFVEVPPPSAIQMNCPPNLTVGIYGNDCTTAVTLPIVSASSTCGGSVLVTYSTPWGTHQGPYIGITAGYYPVQLTANDLCGNTISCNFQIHVIDKKIPKPICVQTLYANITSNGQMMTYARSFDQNSYDNCSTSSALRFSFSANVADSMRAYNCADIGVHQLQIYVFDTDGNQAYTYSKLEILDPQQACNGVMEVRPSIRTVDNEPIANADVKIQQGTQTVLQQSSTTGTCQDQILANNLDCKISCELNLDPLNGVTIFDVFLLQRYILGLDSLSAWQMLAADVTGDNKVTSSDIIELRKLVLGINDQLVGGKSWRFVPESFTFPNINNPFETPIPEEIIIEKGSIGVQDATFVGVKLGDLNQSCIPNYQSIAQSRTVNNQVQIRIQDAFLRSGKQVNVPVYIEPSEQLAGLQFSLAFLPQYMEVISVNGHTTPSGEEVYTHLQQEFNTINANYTGSLSHEQRTNLITVSVLPKTDGYLSDFISLNTSQANAEAFNKLGTMYNIQLDYNHPFLVPVAESDTQPITMIGNSPNPFVEMSILHFSLAQEAHTTLRVFDADGRQVNVQRSFFTKGSQMFLLKREDLGHPGVYNCRIETEFGCVTRKVILF